MASSEKDIIKQVDEAFTRNDVEGFLAFCDDDFVQDLGWKRPVGPRCRASW